MRAKRIIYTPEYYRVYQDGMMFEPEDIIDIINGDVEWKTKNGGGYVPHNDLMFYCRQGEKTIFMVCTGKLDKFEHPIFKYDYIRNESGDTILVDFGNERWNIDHINLSKYEIVGNKFETPNEFFEYQCDKCHERFEDEEELKEIGTYKLCGGCRDEFEDWVN